ncbi:MAG: hypothetical protein F6K50_17915 [Moorea sp. SIO3I7]|uniref:hypothetical protein n=1 Tax=Moorena sp. SIO3I8 TaxID=2607833 RepID=UPI0013C264E8|nr:hypothetical protein [Moorena sp. SIO3I8]NEN97331.1 hypothetical protein [Moorena sp. SIO3I7]NEO08520.1 hypothetical protein [Moorena sp. SIO3I8]
MLLWSRLANADKTDSRQNSSVCSEVEINYLRSHSRGQLYAIAFPITDSRFPNYSGIDGFANSGHHST